MWSIKKFKRKKKNKKVVVHIGKCGGSSVIDEMKKQNIEFIERHVSKVEYRSNRDYIIIIRNPISRFISAFNWRYKLVIEDGEQKDKYLGEREMLEKYKDVNTLAENIYDEKGNLLLDFQNKEFYIHHIKEDINFYLDNLLKKCRPQQIVAVLVTETLKQDFKSFFNKELESHLKKNKKKIQMSSLAVSNLIKYLEKDYMCIDKLNKMGLLNEIQYKELSNKIF